MAGLLSVHGDPHEALDLAFKQFRVFRRSGDDGRARGLVRMRNDQYILFIVLFTECFVKIGSKGVFLDGSRFSSIRRAKQDVAMTAQHAQATPLVTGIGNELPFFMKLAYEGLQHLPLVVIQPEVVL